MGKVRDKGEEEEGREGRGGEGRRELRTHTHLVHDRCFVSIFVNGDGSGVHPCVGAEVTQTYI